MALELAPLLAEYTQPPLGPDPGNGRRERVCEGCGANLFDRAHRSFCAHRMPPLVRTLALTPEDRRAEVALQRATEQALECWLASGRSTAYEQGRAP